MVTKRAAVALLSADDLKLLAEAAEKGATKTNFNAKELKAVKRGIKTLRTVRAAQ